MIQEAIDSICEGDPDHHLELGSFRRILYHGESGPFSAFVLVIPQKTSMVIDKQNHSSIWNKQMLHLQKILHFWLRHKEVISYLGGGLHSQTAFVVEFLLLLLWFSVCLLSPPPPPPPPPHTHTHPSLLTFLTRTTMAYRHPVLKLEH